MRYSPAAGRRKLFWVTSKRLDGSMEYASGVADAKNLENRRRFLHKLNIPFSRLARCTQVHGNKILVVEKRFPGRGDRADGLFTREANAFLGIVTADCLPIFFWDRASSAIGIVHAGWRGVVRRITTKMVLQFRSSGIPPRSMRVVIGPAIQKCHFEIWPDTRHKGLKPFLRSHQSFLKRKKLLIEGKGKVFLDLPGIVREELIHAGIPKSHIRSTGECTFHLSRSFFSYRRKSLGGRDQFGNMLSVIGIREIYR